MPKDDENLSSFSDVPLPAAELRAFAPEQMVSCDECLRANPPTRVECLYCGKALTLSETTMALARPSLRPLEKWEQGYNSILMHFSPDGVSDRSMDQAAGLLRLEGEVLRQILRSRRPLPLARAATHAEALIIQQSLSALGLETLIVSDQALAYEASPPRRLRTIDLQESDLVMYQTSALEGTSIPWSEILLVMTGRLFASQLAFKERKRRGPEKEILDASETSSDEAVLDIYSRNQDSGWRIMGNNFDFSCLGDRKTLLANENFSTLTTVIRDRAPLAEHDYSYNNLRRMLEPVWPSEQQTVSRGWQRDRAGKYGTSEVTMTSNQSQFTRYSRLCHFLKVTSFDRR